MKDNVKHVFKTHPTATKVYETEDEMLFLKEEDALAHKQDKGFKKALEEHEKPVEEESEKEKTPSMKWTVEKLHEYMDEAGLHYEEESKKDLLELIENSKK